LNTEKINIVKLIFEKALGIHLSERDRFLEKECYGDEEIKKEVKSLLDAYTQTEDFLEVPTIQSLENMESATPIDPLIGKHIGNYLIEGEVGIGGMGIVYKGKRDDKEFEHKIAVKILKHNFNSEYVLKRFQIERQTLANLQHPNIARLLDGGKSDDGLPYLVMEFIDGVPITEYCDKNKLTTRSRLELFRTVCGAVQYAHQNLVVHRDIKPGNVLVNQEGRPKLLDFGIAKLIDKNVNETDKGLTKTGMWNLTPEYASPEQINGENITTRSDIYSLGILLYELITGHQPYKITGATPAAISKIITEEQIDKPSDKFRSTEDISGFDGSVKKITPESISEMRNEKPERIYQYLKGDLDNIVIKATHKDPERRYSSVDQFSEDIKRYLTGLPVIARKDTLTYRMSKFISRHKIGVALSVLLTLILLTSTILITWQADLAAKQRDKAQTEALKFEQVNSFLQEMLSSVDPTEIGRDVKVYDILERAAEDIEINLKNQPDIEASIRSTLGNTYVSLGEYDKGVPFLEKALQINEEIYGVNSGQVAKSFHDLGLYYDWIGNYKIADSLYGKSIKIFRNVIRKPDKNFAAAINDYAVLRMNYGQYDEAENYFKEALEVFKNFDNGINRDVASVMNNMAIVFHYKDNLIGAEKYYLKAQELFIKLFGEDHPEVASTYNNLAFVYVDKNELNKAEEYFYKSYKMKLSLKGKDHPDVGLALNNLGGLNVKMRNYKKAEKYLKEALQQYRKTLPDDHVWVGLSHYWLGELYLKTNSFNYAENHLRKSLEIRVKNLPEDNNDIWQSRAELGICLYELEKYSEAESLLLSSLEYFNENHLESTEQLTRLYENIIKLYESTGDEENAAIYKDQLKTFNP